MDLLGLDFQSSAHFLSIVVGCDVYLLLHQQVEVIIYGRAN
jgi:hypothetical protein